MTTEVINNLFGIKESFELPQVLLAKLLDKVEKDSCVRNLSSKVSTAITIVCVTIFKRITQTAVI